MNPVVRTVLLSLGAVVLGALIVTGLTRVMERQRTAEEIDRLREDLYRSRVAADRCRGSLQTSEASLRGLGLTIDSLKSRVDSFEALDRRGVPQDRYDEYIEIFDSFNDSVSVWASREERLRTAEASCRETIQEHNALTDSLQSVLAEAGIEAG